MLRAVGGYQPAGTASRLKESLMKSKLAIVGLAIAALVGPALIYAADADTDRSEPKSFVKDSAITMKVKSRLAAENITSLGNIHVDTDANGVVYLSGTARSQKEIRKAVSIARHTEHVKSVKNELTVKKDD
jgi:hyperosmotically inducible protein